MLGLRIRAFRNIQQIRQLGLTMRCTSSLDISSEPRAGELFKIATPMVRDKSTAMLICVQTLNLSANVAVSSVMWLASAAVPSCGSPSAPQCNSGNWRILQALLKCSRALQIRGFLMSMRISALLLLSSMRRPAASVMSLTVLALSCVYEGSFH